MARKNLPLAILQTSEEVKILSEHKKELAMEAFDEVVGGAKKVQKKNIQKKNIQNSNRDGTQKIGNQGNNNSLDGQYHGGNGISQQNKVEGNSGPVTVKGPAIIENNPNATINL